MNGAPNAVIAHDPEGRFIRTIAMYTEVADQARADWKYRQLYRATPAMLHTVDVDGCIVTVTDRWLQKMGYSREEVVGRSIADFYSKSDRKRFMNGGLQKIISGGEFNNEERQLVTKTGMSVLVAMILLGLRSVPPVIEIFEIWSGQRMSI